LWDVPILPWVFALTDPLGVPNLLLPHMTADGLLHAVVFCHRLWEDSWRPMPRSSSPRSGPRGRPTDGCRLRACRPLVGPSDDLERELALPQQRDHQPAPQVRRVRLHVAWRTERYQPVDIEVRAPLGALDDVVDLEGAPAATGLAPPAGAPEHHPADRRLQGGPRTAGGRRRRVNVAARVRQPARKIPIGCGVLATSVPTSKNRSPSSMASISGIAASTVRRQRSPGGLGSGTRDRVSSAAEIFSCRVPIGSCRRPWGGSMFQGAGASRRCRAAATRRRRAWPGSTGPPRGLWPWMRPGCSSSSWHASCVFRTVVIAHSDAS
jgi:hypothetical protein